jgi:hypothetical protein
MGRPFPVQLYTPHMTVYTQYFRIHRMQRNLESLKLNSKGVHAAALEELSTRDPIHKAKK